ncbi:hypothetical protein ZWY2020_015886 [Hordeum vulgare]|nr:hypothetical protein ZWY2020_015886 [Hordeum vulgare]
MSRQPLCSWTLHQKPSAGNRSQGKSTVTEPRVQAGAGSVVTEPSGQGGEGSEAQVSLPLKRDRRTSEAPSSAAAVEIQASSTTPGGGADEDRDSAPWPEARISPPLRRRRWTEEASSSTSAGEDGAPVSSAPSAAPSGTASETSAIRARVVDASASAAPVQDPAVGGGEGDEPEVQGPAQPFQIAEPEPVLEIHGYEPPVPVPAVHAAPAAAVAQGNRRVPVDILFRSNLNRDFISENLQAGDAERRLRVLLLYAIFEHAGDWPAIDVSEARLVFKLDPTTFNYMAVSDGIQRYMPGAADRDAPRAVPLAYKEAVLLVNPSEPQFVGGDKYQYYSMDNKENRVHGWIAGAGGGDGGDPRGGLWEDAKAQAEDSFPESPDFHKAGERGFVTGRQVVDVPAGLACVGLVTPGRRRARATSSG